MIEEFQDPKEIYGTAPFITARALENLRDLNKQMSAYIEYAELCEQVVSRTAARSMRRRIKDAWLVLINRRIAI